MLTDAAGRPFDPPPGDDWPSRTARFLHARPETFVVDPSRAGFDARAVGDVGGLPNRARLKAFSPQERVHVLFLYKDSQTPFSDDRFAYGALVAKNAPPSDADLSAAVDYVVSGLHPEKRPPTLKRTFPYTVPR